MIGEATFTRGWALAAQGQREEGMAQMRQGLAAWRATGQGLTLAEFLARLAEAYGQIGQAEEGLRLLAEALAVVDNGERVLVRGRAVSDQGRAAAAAGRPGRTPGGSLLPAGPRRGPPPAGQVVGAADGAEPELACGSSRASAPKPARCWPRSMAGSPKDLTPPTFRRPEHCSMRWRERWLLHGKIPRWQ